MPTDCEIEFEDNPSRVIYSGQLLHGIVHLKLTEEKRIRAFFIKVAGRAYANWCDGSGDSKKSYTGNEEYLNEQIYLVGNSDGEAQITLPPGSYHYPFQHNLPLELPTSFESEFGYIRYHIRAVLAVSTQPDEEFDEPFTVIKTVDLNADPTLRLPLILQQTKTFNPCYVFCCCQTGPLIITARTPVGGYAPGQTINLNIKVCNRSDRPVYGFMVTLIKEINYHAYTNSTKHKFDSIVVAEAQAHGSGFYQNKEIPVNIRVPSVPTTDIITSNVIKLRYYCDIIGSVPDCSLPVIRLPILIGSYPLLDEPQPRAPTTLPLPAYGDVVQFPNDEPPTYEEAIQFGNVADREFIPKYPVFNQETSYSTNNNGGD